MRFRDMVLHNIYLYMFVVVTSRISIDTWTWYGSWLMISFQRYFQMNVVDGNFLLKVIGVSPGNDAEQATWAMVPQVKDAYEHHQTLMN